MAAGMPRQPMTLRIADFHHYPLPITFFQGVLHCHATVYVWITLRMKCHGGIGQIFVEAHISRRDVQRLQIEPSAFL